MPDLAALTIGWGERPTDASAAMRIGQFLTDEARRRGTLPEGATAGKVATTTATDGRKVRGHSLMRQWDYSPDRSPPPNTGTGEYRPGPPDDVAPWLVMARGCGAGRDSPVGAGTNRKAALRDARRRVGPGGPPLAAVRTTERERATLRRLRGEPVKK